MRLPGIEICTPINHSLNLPYPLRHQYCYTLDSVRRKVVCLAGDSLTISQVASVAAAGSSSADANGKIIRVELSEAAKLGVKASSDWFMESMNKGTDCCAATTGFAANFHRKTNNGVAPAIVMASH
ncbi:hypothetical protein C5167_028922 [Papaver somniferum]|nr:hypothetical protein C5167_028922 [Papaver somniferum]